MEPATNAMEIRWYITPPCKVNTDTSFSQEISMNNDVPDYFAEIREIHNDHGEIIFVTGHGLAHHLA